MILDALGGFNGPVIVLMASILGIAIAVIVKSKYPIKAIIFEKRANGFVIKFAKAGRVKNRESGVWEYVMKLPKFPMGETKNTKPQKYENIYMDDKGKPILFTYSDGKDQYVPCGIETFEEMLGTKIKVLDEDLCQFQVHSYRDAETKYKARQDFWAKYGGIITIAMLGITLAIVFYGAGNLFSNIADKNAEASNILSTLTNALPKGQLATATGG